MSTSITLIECARRGAGLTQVKFAVKLEIDPSSVSRWERLVSKPETAHLMRAAELLGCSVADLDGEVSVSAADLDAIRGTGQRARDAAKRVLRKRSRKAS